MSSATSKISSSSLSNPDLDVTVCAVFFGFSMSAMLYGIMTRQAYQYYVYEDDTKIRRAIIGLVCLLDTLHFVFTMNMVYCFFRQLLGDVGAGWHVVWSLRGLAVTQTLLVLLVHVYYLTQMWRFTHNMVLLRKQYILAAQVFVITVAVFAFAVAGIFLSQLPRVDVIFGFDQDIEYILYLGFGTTALVDCSIAGAMCVILYKCSSDLDPRISRTESVLESLIQYFVATGLLTSSAAILVITLYVARPHTLLYLAVEYSVTRLYANSILAMFNARRSFTERMNQTIEINLPDSMTTIGPAQTISPTGWHNDNTLTNSNTRYSPAVESPRYTHMGVNFHQPEPTRAGQKKIPRFLERHSF